jgi:hypothetical protein
VLARLSRLDRPLAFLVEEITRQQADAFDHDTCAISARQVRWRCGCSD